MSGLPPLALSVELTCSAQHAFTIWTTRINSWWPADHTVSGRPTEIVLEGRVGGRIYERAAGDAEHDWGRVTAWEPPALLAYTWHLGQGPARATDVEIRFLPRGTGSVVEIRHDGWERLGADAEQWRGRNQGGWTTLLPHFRTATHSPTSPTTTNGDDDGRGHEG